MTDTSTHGISRSEELIDTSTSAPIDNNDREICDNSGNNTLQNLTFQDFLLQSQQHSQYRYFNRMYNICREFCFVMALMFTTYAAFQNGSPKISHSPPARPFFPAGSLVTDWFRGELSASMARASQYDMSFIMYYAPWDAESQAVRKEFDVAASFYYKHVHFAAVNCWQPGSECAMQRDKLGGGVWPGLVAHIGKRGLVYRGPMTAPYMLRFLRNLAFPLHRINSVDDLSRLLSTHDAVVVGFTETPEQYAVLYSASLMILERDPLREVAVAVSMGPFSAQHLEPSLLPTLRLVMWNETLEYSLENGWNANNLAVWVLTKLHRPVGWTSPPGLGKSQTLATILKPGPALLLFTPRNALIQRDDYYEVLRQVSLDYYNCDNSNVMASVLKKLSQIHRIENQQIRNNLKKRCIGKNTFELKPSKIKNKPFANVSINNSYCSKGQTNDFLHTCSNVKSTNDENFNYFDTCLLETFSKIVVNDNYNVILENNKQLPVNTNKKVVTSMLNSDDDPRSPDSLLHQRQRETCRFFLAAYHIYKPVFAELESPINDVTGLGCKTNKSLSIAALDSLRYFELANSLGIEVLSKPDQTAVVIIDTNHETHYVMDAAFSVTNLQSFIMNFTKNILNRELLSKIEGIHASSSNISKKNATQKLIFVPELTSETFLPTIMEHGKNTVVLFHNSQCAFCIDASRIILRTARLFSELKFLKFFRIDGEKNTLPWNFHMHHYPTVLFFPSRRKEESRVFPQNVLRTVSHFVSFIVANLDPPARLHAMWLLCRHSQFSEDMQSCISNVRRESISLIGTLLREWRRISGQLKQDARGLFKCLQHLRLLHLLLGTVASEVQNVDAIELSLMKLQKAWISVNLQIVYNS